MKLTRLNSVRRVAIATLITTVALGAMGGSSYAGKGGGRPGGGGGTTSSSSLSVVMVTDADSDGITSHGDTITFNITTADTAEPNVSLSCKQGGVVVYGAVAGFYAGYPWPWTTNMELLSPNWSGGAADCTAVLQKYSGTKVLNLATINFTVAA